MRGPASLVFLVAKGVGLFAVFGMFEYTMT